MLDLNDYRHTTFSLVKSICEFRADENPYDLIGDIALATECPIIVVAHYVGEIYGQTPELLSQIDRFMIFYNETEVRGIKH